MIILESRGTAERDSLKFITKKEVTAEIYSLQKPLIPDCASEFNLVKVKP